MDAQPNQQSQVRADFIQWVLGLTDDECRAALVVVPLVKDAAKPDASVARASEND